jgi:uncharacterized protein (DUF58 family)
LDLAALVYPRPIASARPLSGSSNAIDGVRLFKHGSEDFHDFRRYRPGDNLRHVLWRAYAKGQPLQSQVFAESLSQSHWLDYDAVEGDRERRLGVLCFWVLELQRSNEPFGLQVPGQKLELGIGDEHCQRALRMLALFGKKELGKSESSRDHNLKNTQSRNRKHRD